MTKTPKQWLEEVTVSRNRKRKDNWFTASCPICSDSQEVIALGSDAVAEAAVIVALRRLAPMAELEPSGRIARIVRVSHTLILVALIAVGCSTHDDEPRLIKKANVETPSDAKAVSGSYFRGDGTGCNIYLTLNPDGSYAAEWQGCLGKYGDASGTWRLDGNRVMFTPTSGIDMMKCHLRMLDVQRFEGDWILLPTRKEDREFYEKWGVSRVSCFQKKDRVLAAERQSQMILLHPASRWAGPSIALPTSRNQVSQFFELRLGPSRRESSRHPPKACDPHSVH